MVKLGNFLFHNRNGLFPLFYLFLFIPIGSVTSNFWPMLVAGFLVGLSGQAIRIATIGLKYIIRGGQNRRVYAKDLVTEGLFSHSRNPLYVGNVLMLCGLGIMSNTWWFLLLFIPLFIFFYQAIIRAEEDFLYNKFGEAYKNYQNDVNRWVPRLSGLWNTLNSMDFNWQRVIVKEYNTTYIWLTGVVLMVVKAYFLHNKDVFASIQMPVIVTLVLLLALYLFARFLKKSKRLRA